METLVRGRRYKDESHYHDAKEHGLAWAVLNELLHVIVFVYTLFGMIQFRVKFIRMIELVKWISKLVIAHNWYLSIKFALVTMLMYFYNIKLDRQSINVADLNCSLANHRLVLEARHFSLPSNKTTHHQNSMTSKHSFEGVASSNLAGNWLLVQLPEYLFHLDYLPVFTHLLDTLGGPFRLLGNSATLLYGVYSIATYIMLVIFPIELMYYDVGFNFIRFVLSDPGCMRDFYGKRNKHLDRLSSWSRNQADSMLTQGAKMILSQRDLRSNYTDDFNQLASYKFHPDRSHRHVRLMSPWHNNIDFEHVDCFEPSWHDFPEYLISNDDDEYQAGYQGEFREEDQELEQDGKPKRHQSRTKRQVGQSYLPSAKWLRRNSNRKKSHHIKMAQAFQLEYKLSNNVKRLKTRLAINHLNRPSYQVTIANRNLRKFKPFVRSDIWFKASMIIYPIFIFFYFILHMLIIGLIERYFEHSFSETIERCKQNMALLLEHRDHQEAARETSPKEHDLFEWANWSLTDKVMLYESTYTVFILSCASSFYTSYYFGTILELTIWIKEISQQLELSAHVIELTEVLTHTSDLSPMQARQLLSSSVDLRMIKFYVNDFGGLNELFPAYLERRALDKLARGEGRRKSSSSPAQRMNLHQADRTKFKLRELMAIRLLTKKETLLRATYVNICLFFDELHETKFMTSTILRRTSQISSGFAFMASITRSQFKANYSHLNSLLIGTLLVFNLYLACAAYVNSGVNRMLVQIHSLISASLRTSSEDADLFEFWLRHVSAFGEDKDVTAYNIYGYKVTWSTIMNVSDSQVNGASTLGGFENF